MEEDLPTLEDFAWTVLRMRDAQKAFEQDGTPFTGHRMRAAEKAVDDIVARICLPPLPFESKGDQS